MICDMQKIEKSQLENYVGKPVYVKGVCWNRSFDGWTVIYRRESGDLWFDYRGGNYPVNGFLPNEFTIGSSKNNCFSEFPIVFCKDCRYFIYIIIFINTFNRIFKVCIIIFNFYII